MGALEDSLLIMATLVVLCQYEIDGYLLFVPKHMTAAGIGNFSRNPALSLGTEAGHCAVVV